MIWTTDRLEQIADAIHLIAAREILPRWRNLAAADVRDKAPNDPVTAADLAAEAALRTTLAGIDPDAALLCEEDRDHAPALAALNAGRATWTIDPLDGTRPFAAGLEGFHVLVSWCRDRTPEAAWIHDPVGGETLMAGNGLAWRRTGAVGRARTLPLVTDRLPAADEFVVLDDLGPTPASRAVRAHALAAGWRVPDNRLSGSWALARILRGATAHAYCALMRPWDYLPLQGVLSAAGGVFDGAAPGLPHDLSGKDGLFSRSLAANLRVQGALRRPDRPRSG